jgi:hypothetical protein
VTPVPASVPVCRRTPPRGDIALALVLAGLTAASRIPFTSRVLPTWDAVQFALALREYDVVKHQPHPPGYILYVAAGRGLDALLGDPARSLGFISVAASALTVFLVYRLAWQLYGRAAAMLAAAGLALSPLFWFHGVIGLSYAAEAALATLVAWLGWRARDGGIGAVLWSALALGLAGGVRQSILVVLGPLWLAMVWTASRRRPRVLAAALAVLAGATGAWLVPMVYLSGGTRVYLGAARELYESTVRATTLAGPHWLGNVIGLGEALTLGVGLVLPLLVAAALARLRALAAWGPRAWFFAAWILPPLVVYVGVHFGQYGYLLTILPALYIVVARTALLGAERLCARTGRRAGRALVTAACAAVLVLHTVFFVAAQPLEVPPPGDDPSAVARWRASAGAHYRYGLWTTTAPGLREQADVIGTYLEAIRRDFDPADTVLVTELGNPRSYPWYRHVMYYLPEFAVYHLRVGDFSPGYLSSRHAETMAALDGPEILLAATTRRIVWVVDYWNPGVPRPSGLEARPLAHGRWLYVVEVDRRPLRYAGYRLAPVTALARLR